MKALIAATLAAVAALGLAGCQDPHKGEHCVARSTVLVPISHPGTKYRVGFTTYVYMSECSQWAPNNPATVSP